MLTQMHFHAPFAPIADPAAVVISGNARFTVLKPNLIRMEYAPAGQFEDRASQPFWYRHQPVPAFQTDRQAGRLTIETSALLLTYLEGSPFDEESLQVQVKANAVTWHAGDPNPRNLLGTTRTLDETRGVIVLEEGLNSRDGWALVDDSTTLVFNDQGWLENRDVPEGQLDWYFFGYGHEYLLCLLDYQDVTGRAPLLPRWALGNWWSRYWEYSADELGGLMDEFKEQQIPLSVCIIDMDWHLTRTGNDSNGWTGYTWNRDLFPDPPGFIHWLHEQGLRTSLNLHPALGVWNHEEQYQDMARAIGQDPADGKPVMFDIADPTFAKAYFEVLHHPLEAQGVDFWWMDWQQGKESKVKGLDPLWWLNHLHFYDLGRNGKRPFVFSRWGGLGNHRYPIGFSGDTEVTWGALAYQPYFTASAANVGYGWWSHDIGGHYFGHEDGGRYTRWVQFGAFSPILRLHCTKDPYLERRPWGYDDRVLSITSQFMRLRHALVPFIYTLSWRNESQGVPPILPMYYDHPEQEEAYHAQHQYMLGGSLLVAPVTAPEDPELGRSKWGAWLPQGQWFDFFTGQPYTGGSWVSLFPRLEDMPVFAKAGAIVPLARGEGVDYFEKFGTPLPVEMDIVVFPGADGEFELFEDDGDTTAYRNGHYRLIRFENRWTAGHMTVRVHAATGDHLVGPQDREYNLVVRGVREPAQVSVKVDGAEQELEWIYDEANRELYVGPLDVSVESDVEVIITAAGGGLIAENDLRRQNVLELLRSMPMPTFAKVRIERKLPELLEDVHALGMFLPVLTAVQTQALAEALTGAGSLYLPESGNRARVIVWNPTGRTGLQIQQSVMYETWWHTDRFQLSQAPVFQVIFPEELGDHPRAHWMLRLDYFGLTDVVYDGGKAEK